MKGTMPSPNIGQEEERKFQIMIGDMMITRTVIIGIVILTVRIIVLIIVTLHINTIVGS